MERDGPSWELERRAWSAGHELVAGCDEAGRGPLAGPVVAAAVILPREVELDGLDDSKKLDAETRLRLYHLVREHCVACGVALASPAEIDRVNILQASLQAMRRAIGALSPAPHLVLVDGNRAVPGLALRQETVVKGDGRSCSVAAASIVAKVTRDGILERLDKLYPGYGLASNKGYPSPDHLEALRRLGATAIHRASYAPVRAVLAEPPPLPPARSRRPKPQQLSLFEDDLA